MSKVRFLNFEDDTEEIQPGDSVIIVREDGQVEVAPAMDKAEPSEDGEEMIHLFDSAFTVLAIMAFLNDQDAVDKYLVGFTDAMTSVEPDNNSD
jgi:hypothetical protein